MRPVPFQPCRANRARRRQATGALFTLTMVGLIAAGCSASVSYTETGGGSADEASRCIEINFTDDAEMQSVITNSCSRDINFVEFSTGSRGLFVVPASSTITRTETIAAWGACFAPAIPERTGDFEFFCD